MTGGVIFSLIVWAGIVLSVVKACGAGFLHDVSWWLTTAPIWGAVIGGAGFVWGFIHCLTVDHSVTEEDIYDSLTW